MDTEKKKKTRGRPKLRSPGTKKKLRQILDSTKFKVNVGRHEGRWNRLKNESGVKTHEEFAGLLLDSYCQQQSCSNTSTAPSKSASAVMASIDGMQSQTPVQHSKHRDPSNNSMYPNIPTALSTQTAACGPSQSTPLLTSRALIDNQPDVSDISCSDVNEQDCYMSGVEVMPSTSKKLFASSRLQSRYLTQERTCQDTQSSFINPFDLTIYTSEDQAVDDDGDFDPEYEPSFNISLGPVMQDTGSDIEMDEVVFDFEDNSDSAVDETDQEEFGTGLMKISSPEDSSLLTDDQLFLVYFSPLLDLAATKIDSVCKMESCSRAVLTKTNIIGSALYIIWVCENGHEVHKWCSQPILNRRLHGGDLMLSAAILFSGNNFSKIRLMARFLNLRLVGTTSFNLIQRTYLVPAVDEMWAEKQTQVLSEFEGQGVVIAGDGRMDSPGHCAQYCTYTVMENTTKKILSCITLDKREAGGKSTNLEKLGFVKSMTALRDKNVDIVEVITDAHMQISSVMKRQYSDVKHSYDLWHVAKNLGKKITKAGQEKTCRALIGWTKHVVNHFWYAAEKAETYDQFIGIWFGLIHHVVNEHEWILAYGSEGSSQCQHGPLEEEGRNVEWLKKDSKAHKTLVEIIANKRLLNNIPYYLNARSTAELENFQNHILMYAAKRFSFIPPVYRARNLLAALDYNEHIDRRLQLNKDGKQRYQRLYNKKSQRYSAIPVKAPKTFPHIPDLMTKVVHRRLTDRVGMKRKMVLEPGDPRRLAPTLAPAPPPTHVIVQETKSRRKEK